jgi:4-hydroxy-4-methyl-2-oxoglutarate aldolase
VAVSKELIEALKAVPTGSLSDGLGKTGAMHHSIKPVYKGAKLAGPAVTVYCQPGDNLTPHKAIAEAEPGSVLVINAGNGYTEAGLLGEIMALAAQLKGLAGVVIDGACRDVDDIEAMDFPVFARAVNPGGTVKESLGKINTTIQCGGQVVNPGDIIAGDTDGVVVIPAGKVEEVLKKAEAIHEKEVWVKEQMKQGKTTMEIYGFDKLLEQKGLK